MSKLLDKPRMLGKKETADQQIEKIDDNIHDLWKRTNNLVLEFETLKKSVGNRHFVKIGRWQICEDGNNLIFQHLENNNWVTKNTITP